MRKEKLFKYCNRKGIVMVEFRELIELTLSKGLNYILELFKRGEIKRDDLILALNISTVKELTDLKNTFNDFKKDFEGFRKGFENFEKEFESFKKSFDDYRYETLKLLKDINDKLDVISNQLRVLNTNISSTYELTSKIMAKLMELSISQR